MPGVVARLIDNLPTREERSVARRLWNRSLPVAANVGVIEFNRVEAGMFGERVAERYGEEWAGRVEGLKGRLNGGAGVVGGKGEGKGGEGGGVGGKEDLGKGDMKWVEVPEGTGKESETRTPNEIGAKATKPETRILDHVAEAAALVVKIEKEPETEAAESTIVRDKEAHEKPDDEATEAAVSLVSLSDTPTNNPTNDPESLAASNALSALWYLIDRFFSSGHEAASYFFVALEAAIRLEQTTVHALNIPAPPAFWTDAADWKVPKVGMALVLTLASSENNMFDAFARFSKSLGKPALSVEEMRKKNSASLRKAVLRAKDDALNKKRTTILGVDLRDLRYSQLCEQQGKGVEKHFATFARRFVLGVCPEGAKLWLVGGEWGETTTVWESNNKVGAAVGTWEEMDEFVRAFEGFAVPNVRHPFLPHIPLRLMGWLVANKVPQGKWTSKRFKWFRRCFAVDLKQFDLQIDDEEKKKRGMQKKDEGVKRLLIDIEAWVDIYKIEDVKREDVGKFSWL